ncbi:unnamed protein product [Dovyalis caffra]|uniref:Fe2OG dioxygenase domain-containing protein n=1 Tax=Dovyalis caffra TaxID=77055 RepID=A0AAV1R8U6_9ROSI|nr:unnamed protein product [Dovyalis caffra]
MGDLDPAFIQDLENRPTVRVLEDEEVPVIDLSTSSPGDSKELVSKIKDACRKWGFFQVINHGVPSDLGKRMVKTAKEFFDQPIEEKKKVKRDEGNSMGYHDAEHTKNVRDWKDVFDFSLEDPRLIPASDDPNDPKLRTISNRWPQSPSEFREVCQEYSREVEKLGYKLLELVSLSLGLPANRLNGYFNDQTSLCRINHYPPCPNPHLALGVGRHKDFSALTVLAQDDVGGLEIRRKSDGEWIPVNPIADAFIINVWSNDTYESVEHRVVVNTEMERFSIPVLLLPSHHVIIKPLEELLNEQNPARYQGYNWGKFYASRYRGDYKKRDVENIQIHLFKK